MLNKTYLFYSITATGVNPVFDQIFQFAAIRTDSRFNVIARHNLTLRLRPDVLPSPISVVTHRISIKQMLQGVSEYDVALFIHGLFNEPGTISVGWNNLKVDAHFIRFMFHRNLLHPYTHQYLNGCEQIDLLPIMVVASYLESNPVSLFDGLKADAHMTAAEKAEAILCAARSIADKWDSLLSICSKDAEQKRASTLRVVCKSKIHGMSQIEHTLGVVVGGRGLAAGLFIGDSINYKKDSLWLRIDCPGFKELTRENFIDTAEVIRKKPGLRFTFNYENIYFSPEINSVIESNLQWLLTQPDLLGEIVKYYREFKYPTQEMDPDASLYSISFPGQRDLLTNQQFHGATVEQKISMVFSRPLYDEISRRILWRNFAVSEPRTRDSFSRYMKKEVVDFKGQKKPRPSEILSKISETHKALPLDTKQRMLLTELESYITNTFMVAAGQQIQVLQKKIPGASSRLDWLQRNYWLIVEWFRKRGQQPATGAAGY